MGVERSAPSFFGFFEFFSAIFLRFFAFFHVFFPIFFLFWVGEGRKTCLPPTNSASSQLCNKVWARFTRFQHHCSAIACKCTKTSAEADPHRLYFLSFPSFAFSSIWICTLLLKPHSIRCLHSLFHFCFFAFFPFSWSPSPPAPFTHPPLPSPRHSSSAVVLAARTHTLSPHPLDLSSPSPPRFMDSVWIRIQRNRDPEIVRSLDLDPL